MEAKALADSLVDAGILYKADGLYSLDQPPSHVYCWTTAKMIINDWRTAGKCLESILGDGLHVDSHITDIGEHEFCITTNFDQTVEITYNESLPRAIVEAFCEARQ